MSHAIPPTIRNQKVTRASITKTHKGNMWSRLIRRRTIDRTKLSKKFDRFEFPFVSSRYSLLASSSILCSVTLFFFLWLLLLPLESLTLKWPLHISRCSKQVQRHSFLFTEEFLSKTSSRYVKGEARWDVKIFKLRWVYQFNHIFPHEKFVFQSDREEISALQSCCVFFSFFAIHYDLKARDSICLITLTRSRCVFCLVFVLHWRIGRISKSSSQ